MNEFFLGMLGIIIFFTLYFLPWIVAANRNAKNRAGVAILNLFLGWTLLGWVGALIWAVCANPKSEK